MVMAVSCMWMLKPFVWPGALQWHGALQGCMCFWLPLAWCCPVGAQLSPPCHGHCAEWQPAPKGQQGMWFCASPSRGTAQRLPTVGMLCERRCPIWGGAIKEAGRWVNFIRHEPCGQCMRVSGCTSPMSASIKVIPNSAAAAAAAVRFLILLGFHSCDGEFINQILNFAFVLKCPMRINSPFTCFSCGKLSCSFTLLPDTGRVSADTFPQEDC